MRTTLLIVMLLAALALLVAAKETFAAPGDAALVCYWAPPPPPIALPARPDPNGIPMPSHEKFSTLLNAPASTQVPLALSMPTPVPIKELRDAALPQDVIKPPYTSASLAPGMNAMLSPLPLPPTVPPTTKIPSLLDPAPPEPPVTTTPPAFVPSVPPGDVPSLVPPARVA